MTFRSNYFQVEPYSFARFQTLCKLSNPLHTLVESGGDYVADFHALLFDVWFSFYASMPIVGEKNGLSSYHTEVIGMLLRNEEMQKWRQFTVNDELFSVLTTLVIGEEIVKQLEQQSIQKKHKDKQKAESMLQSLKKEQQNQELSMVKRERLQFQQKIAERQVERLNDQIKQEAGQQRTPTIDMQQITAKLNKKEQDILKTKQAVVQLSSVDGNKKNTAPLKDQFAIADQLAQKELIRRIAEITGRLKKVAVKKQKSKQKMTMERKEIALGQEIARLLPMELANYVMPKSKLDFYRRFAEQQTFIFGQKGKDTAGRGPIIICLDESSSMTSMKAESKALCIALLSIAKKQRRDFAIVPFASDIGEVRIFPKGKSTADEILSFANAFLTGGTNYEKPLQKSLEILTSSQFNKADILFVTDGTSFLSSKFVAQFNDVKRKRKFECTSIVLSNLYNAVDETVIEKFSDRIIAVNHLLEAEDVFSIV